MSDTSVVVVGVGALGRLVLEAAVRQPDLTVRGAVDVDAALQGREVAGVRVVGSIAELPDARVAIHTATSRRSEAAPQVRALLARGLSVATSCEALHGGDADLDAFAASRGLRVVATGVNPGLVMDRLPALLAAACVSVERVTIRRVVDLAARREPLQRKMGVGLSEADVRARRDLGHVGLRQSMDTVLAATRLAADGFEHALSPIVRAGVCVGQDETLVAVADGVPVATLHLRMEMNATPVDEIAISGDPPIRCVLQGGIHGDRATIALLLCAARELGR